MNWRLLRLDRSKQRVRRYWLFRRIRRLRQARNRPIPPLMRRQVSRLTHSILLIPSNKLFSQTRARAAEYSIHVFDKKNKTYRSAIGITGETQIVRGGRSA